MRTVVYYVPHRIQGPTAVLSGHWSTIDPPISEVPFFPGQVIRVWNENETGVVTMDERDLESLVARGFVILGDICTS